MAYPDCFAVWLTKSLAGEVTAQVNIITGSVHTFTGRSLQKLQDLQLNGTHIGPVLRDLEQQHHHNQKPAVSP